MRSLASIPLLHPGSGEIDPISKSSRTSVIITGSVRSEIETLSLRNINSTFLNFGTLSLGGNQFDHK